MVPHSCVFRIRSLHPALGHTAAHVDVLVGLAGQVSIGADEYNSSLADDYNNFVNEMVRILFRGLGITRLKGRGPLTNHTERLHRTGEREDHTHLGDA